MGYSFKLSSEGVAHVQEHPEDLKLVRRMAHPQTGFREFLNHWYFRPGGKEAALLGTNLWEAQEEFVSWTQMKKWIYFLKARQLGESTIECAFDGWVLRFRGVNERVHIFHKRDDDAVEFLAAVKFGLEHLPSWLQLPTGTDNTHEYVLQAPLAPGEISDERTCKAYPSNNDTARGFPCTHAHIDEWAFMGNPNKVWQSIEPACHGTCHILTTGEGPANFTSGYWRKCMAGDAPHEPVFIGALARPDRSEAWLRAKRAGMDDTAAKQEYPTRWEEALSGGGEYKFTSKECDAAGRDFRSCAPYEIGRKYAGGVDIGRHQDAAVIVVLDVTEDVHDVVYYRRLREVSYPEIQREILTADREYKLGGALGVEANSAGEAVLENLDLPEERVKAAKFTTSKSSKARIIDQVKVGLQNQLIKWDPNACSQLDTEMRGYQLPDENVVQDSVIALAIAEEYAPQAHRGGRVLTPFHV